MAVQFDCATESRIWGAEGVLAWLQSHGHIEKIVDSVQNAITWVVLPPVDASPHRLRLRALPAAPPTSSSPEFHLFQIRMKGLISEVPDTDLELLEPTQTSWEWQYDTDAPPLIELISVMTKATRLHFSVSPQLQD